jgi:hypothetical protein
MCSYLKEKQAVIWKLRVFFFYLIFAFASIRVDLIQVESRLSLYDLLNEKKVERELLQINKSLIINKQKKLKLK